MNGSPELAPDMPIAELGKRMMAAQFAIIQAYLSPLQQEAEVTAVHETRKAIRRTFSAIKLFHPYFEPGLLFKYRRQLKKVMRRLAPCRDTAVFLFKLQAYATESGRPQDKLADYWTAHKSAVDHALQVFLMRPQRHQFWAAYAQFIDIPGQGIPTRGDTITSQKAGHLIPALLHQRVAGVRAFDDFLTGHQLAATDIERLHQLRIQCKELRYAFEFFAPLLGDEITPVIVVLEQLQDNLGNLNDARVALAMLAQMPADEVDPAPYRQVQRGEIGRLLIEFPPLWRELNSPPWRRNLALALAVL